MGHVGFGPPIEVLASPLWDFTFKPTTKTLQKKTFARVD